MSPLPAGGCPVPGCPRTPRPGHLMCRPDWGRVSKPTQQAVYRTWRAYSRTRAAADWAAYIAASGQAVNEADAADQQLEL